MTADKIEMIAAELRWSNPAIGDALARLVLDVRKMERTCDEMVREAKEDAEIDHAHQSLIHTGKAEGWLIALPRLRRGPLGMRA